MAVEGEVDSGERESQLGRASLCLALPLRDDCNLMGECFSQRVKVMPQRSGSA